MDPVFHLRSYSYHLPPELIAQHPTDRRDHSRLLVLTKNNQQLEHTCFTNITNYLRKGDLLVVNDSRVFPARLLGRKQTGGKVEALLLHYPESLQTEETGKPSTNQARVTALLKCSRRPPVGADLLFGEYLRAQILALGDNGRADLKLLFSPAFTLETVLARYGQVPLPPYIRRPRGSTAEDVCRYQTTYAQRPGSVAAPTAGLHFSRPLLAKLENQGIRRAALTLHVGYGTFAPVRVTDIRNHRIHREYVTLSEETASLVNQTRERGGRIWAVGTTSVRTLESAADDHGRVRPMAGYCDLFIYPGHKFQVVDCMITNFHLPQSSLLFLVSAFVGRQRILQAYAEAIKKGYRFFSYGDAMALITDNQ